MRSVSPPKMREIAVWLCTNGVIACFMVMPGSLLYIIEINTNILVH